MDAILLTWRWQNILAIWVMIGLLYLFLTVGHQIMLRSEGNKAANNG